MRYIFVYIAAIVLLAAAANPTVGYYYRYVSDTSAVFYRPIAVKSVTMNDIRSSYVKVLPLVFLTGLLAAGLHLYHDIKLDSPTYPWHNIELLKNTLKCGLIWTIIGVAFKKMKEAAIAISFEAFWQSS
jgi:hypothetical protein